MNCQEDVLIKTEQFAGNLLVGIHHDTLSEAQRCDVVEVLDKAACHDEELSVSVCSVFQAHFIEATE